MYSSPGGDYDVRARLVARHMDRHIPGEPNIIVQNMPGSGGLKAANWLYNVAPKDGTALATLNQQIPLTQAFGTKGVEFDLGRCAWIGNTMSSPIALVTWHTAKAKTMEDTFKVETTMGGTGAGSVQFPLMLNALIGTKFKVIAGYPGGSQIYLAMERGEVDGRATQNWAGWVAQRPNWIKEKKINVLAQGGTAPLPDPDLKGVPLLVDYAKTPEARAIVELFLLPDEIARPIIAGPNLPKERVAALRAAFNATMKDPAFLDEARKEKMEIIASTGEEAQAKALKILHTPKAILDKAKQYAGN